MAARNKARKRAFQILFEADQRGAEVQSVLADWMRHARTDPRQPPVNEYTLQLVEGYAEHVERIDELLGTYSVGWTLDRMPTVDRNVLRLGAYELIWVDETPDAWPSTKRCSWPRNSPRTSRRPSSTACSPV